MEAFPLSEIARLPYVDNPPTDGRQVLLQVPYFDSSTGEWHLYFQPEAGTIGRLAGGEAAYGSFLARSPADPARDVHLPLASLISQHLSFPGVLDPLQRFENDVHNCAAVLEKFHVISRLHERGTYTALLVSTELEYLLALVRSMFDLLHEVVKALVPLFVTLDDKKQRVVKKQLPNSFADVALKGDDLVSGKDIVSRRDLPAHLANWYVHQAPAFRLLRKQRDAVIHRGAQLPTVFDLDDAGLAVAKDEHPWREFAIWSDVEPINDRLVPLRMAFAAIIANTIRASDELVEAIMRFTRLPDPIAKGMRVYLRSPVTHRLIEIPDMMQHPWERRPRES